MESKAIENIVSDIEGYVTETGEQYLSIRTIARRGWLIGARYASVKKLVEGGMLKSFELYLGERKRTPIRKVHYKDLEEYILGSYKN